MTRLSWDIAAPTALALDELDKLAAQRTPRFHEAAEAMCVRMNDGDTLIVGGETLCLVGRYMSTFRVFAWIKIIAPQKWMD